MNKHLTLIGNIVAAIGAALSAIAGAVRIGGHYRVFGFEAMTIFLAGIAVMVFACVLLLQRR
jgi:hypothetical protein